MTITKADPCPLARRTIHLRLYIYRTETQLTSCICLQQQSQRRPRKWFPKDVPETLVLIIFQDGSRQENGKQGRVDLYLVAESVLKALHMAKIKQVRPVILIGHSYHSYDGLVIKQLCLLAQSKVSLPTPKLNGETQRMQTFLENIGGIFYNFHLESCLTDVIQMLERNERELVQYMRVFSKDLARLNQDFEKFPYDLQWHISIIGETLPTDLGGGICFVIIEASARCENFTPVTENHSSICQLQRKESTTYLALVDFMREIQLKEITGREDFRAFLVDCQMLPKKQVSPLGNYEGGEILHNLKTCLVLGLWGMDGIGKSTLSKAIFMDGIGKSTISKAVFNHLHSSFEYTLFVENVMVIWGVRKAFEKTFVDEVYHWGSQVEKASNTPTMFHVNGKELLLVLDDIKIQSDRDIKIVRNTCSASSRVILISRERHRMDQADDIHIVELEAVDLASSETLFRSYDSSPSVTALIEWQQNCMENIVQRGDLPLILEVPGMYLKNTNSQDVWEETLNSLVKADEGETVGMNEVTSKLKGWTLGDAKAIWRVKYKNGALHWRRLADRAMVFEIAEYSSPKIYEHFRTLHQKLGMVDRDLVYEVAEFSTIKIHEHLRTLHQNLGMVDDVT